MIDNQIYLYFPECKIIRSQFIPKKNPFISFYLKSLDKTPNHYPQHVLLNGVVEFSFGLEITKYFKETKQGQYFNLFDCHLNNSPSKLTGKKVSALILFNPTADKKLDTIGLGHVNDIITIYNDNWDTKEIKVISQSSKLNYQFPHKHKSKVSKI